MPSSPSNVLLLELMATTEDSGTWGTKTNTNLQMVEDALCTTFAISTTGGTTTLTNSNFIDDQAKKLRISVTGALTTNATIVVPNANRPFEVNNATSGTNLTVTVQTAAPVTTVSIPQGMTARVYCDGSNNMTYLSPPTVPATGAAGIVGASSGGLRSPVNVGLSITAASNNLTITLTAADGGTPSAADPVLLPFRNAPAMIVGTPVWRTVTAATSFTINNGNTLGTFNSTPFRFWIVAIDNGGTVLLGAIQCSPAGGGVIYQLHPGFLQSTGSGTNGGNSAGTIYTSVSALTSKAICILGYLEYINGLATAGTYSAPPDIVQLAGPDVPRPGQAVQLIQQNTFPLQTTSSTTPLTGLSVQIAPTSASNLIRIDSSAALSATAPALGFAQIYRGATPIGVPGLSQASVSGSGVSYSSWGTTIIDNPGTTATTTYAQKYYTSVSGGSMQYAVTNNATIIVTELMG